MIYLTIPGITNSSEGHWQSIWERQFPAQFERIQQGNWDTPDVADWVDRIDEYVSRDTAAEIVLVAHSLGCVAVNHWAGKYGRKIGGALLVAPSDCETTKYRDTFASTGFDPIPLAPLPFRSVVAASTNDEWVAFDRAQMFANAWNSELVDVGGKGHINGSAGYGQWDDGLELLKRFE